MLENLEFKEAVEPLCISVFLRRYTIMTTECLRNRVSYVTEVIDHINLLLKFLILQHKTDIYQLLLLASQCDFAVILHPCFAISFFQELAYFSYFLGLGFWDWA